VDQILKNFGDTVQGILDSPFVQVGIRAIALYVVLLWLGSAFWAFRDASRRTHNLFAPYAAGALIILATPLFFPFALILYAIVRPGETLLEAWERRMAEEAAAEAVPLCFGCGRRTDPEWLACPSCGQRLHHRCAACGRLMGLDWNLCAWCGSEPAAGAVAVPLSIADRDRRAARRAADAASSGSSASSRPPFTPAGPPDARPRRVASGGATAGPPPAPDDGTESVSAFVSARAPRE
jgi:RNA polymerase subunit RPABC4/transcription elongation factor Spt4